MQRYIVTSKGRFQPTPAMLKNTCNRPTIVLFDYTVNKIYVSLIQRHIDIHVQHNCIKLLHRYEYCFLGAGLYDLMRKDDMKQLHCYNIQVFIVIFFIIAGSKKNKMSVRAKRAGDAFDVERKLEKVNKLHHLHFLPRQLPKRSACVAYMSIYNW